MSAYDEILGAIALALLMGMWVLLVGTCDPDPAPSTPITLELHP